MEGNTWICLSYYVVCGCHLLTVLPTFLVILNFFPDFLIIFYFAYFLFLVILLITVYDMYVLLFGLSKNNNNNNKLWAGGRHDMPTPVTLTFDLLTLKVVSKTCVVGYLCANFGLPRPLCSRLRSDAHDRQTDVRQC